MRMRDRRDLPTTLLLLVLPAFIAAGCVPEPPGVSAPVLLVAAPDFGAVQVPPTTWVALEFADALAVAMDRGITEFPSQGFDGALLIQDRRLDDLHSTLRPLPDLAPLPLQPSLLLV